jgi:ubiquinone/menaquinone biosynthesis C-methylase UbiE
MADEQYNLEELHIALDRSRPENILPPDLPEEAKVLDIGCGSGQTLIATYPNRISFGIDVDPRALAFGKTITSKVCFTQAQAERLPFASESFDLVVARVSLPYTHLPTTLLEIRRVLKPGGQLWATMHPLSIPWNQMKVSNYRGKIFFLYVLLNGIVFHYLQTQFSMLGRCESFQTPQGMRKALAGARFESTTITVNRHFLVTASKPTLS